MITFYSGTPGSAKYNIGSISGKSLDAAREIIFWLKTGRPVIGNMYLNEDVLKKYKGNYYFVDTYAMNPNDFLAFSRKNLKKGKEGQCLIVIDCRKVGIALFTIQPAICNHIFHGYVPPQILSLIQRYINRKLF